MDDNGHDQENNNVISLKKVLYKMLLSLLFYLILRTALWDNTSIWQIKKLNLMNLKNSNREADFRVKESVWRQGHIMILTGTKDTYTFMAHFPWREILNYILWLWCYKECTNMPYEDIFFDLEVPFLL